VLGVLIVALDALERKVLKGIRARGEGCPSFNSLLDAILAMVTDGAQKAARCHITLYEATHDTLTAYVGTHGIGVTPRSFKIDPSNAAENKGVAGRCWFNNRGRPTDPQPEYVNGLPELVRTGSRKKQSSAIETYSELTFDDVQSISQTLPTAKCQIAYPVTVPGHTPDGARTPWGVLLLCSDARIPRARYEVIVSILQDSTGPFHTLEDILAKQQIGQLRHCSGL
jgi:hypothetical protein